VFLGDITAAYQQNPNLESLFFDDFFQRGKAIYWLTGDIQLTIDVF